jgi:hypothetical protein
MSFHNFQNTIACARARHRSRNSLQRIHTRIHVNVHITRVVHVVCMRCTVELRIQIHGWMQRRCFPTLTSSSLSPTSPAIELNERPSIDMVIDTDIGIDIEGTSRIVLIFRVVVRGNKVEQVDVDVCIVLNERVTHTHTTTIIPSGSSSCTNVKL